MVMNISCKFEKASYNIFFFVRAVTVKSLYTLQRQQWCNEAVDTIKEYKDQMIFTANNVNCVKVKIMLVEKIT